MKKKDDRWPSAMVAITVLIGFVPSETAVSIVRFVLPLLYICFLQLSNKFIKKFFVLTL